MSEQLPNTDETVEQAIRRFADQKFRQHGLVEGAAELDAIAHRAAELERKTVGAGWKLAELRTRENLARAIEDGTISDIELYDGLEGECMCGRCIYFDLHWVDTVFCVANLVPSYCAACGDNLCSDGTARRMVPAVRAEELEAALLVAAEEEAHLWASEHTWSEESDNHELLAARAAETCRRWKQQVREELEAESDGST